MSKTLIIGTEEFEFPTQNQNPDWGEVVTDWATAVTDSLQNVQSANDILITSASIGNNVVSATNIPGFSFDTSEVVTIYAEFYIKRTTDTPSNNLVENGFIEGNFDGSSWTISIRSVGNSGVSLDISPSGQVTYLSSQIIGSNYTGIIKFRAKVINQA